MPRVSRRAKHLFICLNIIYGIIGGLVIFVPLSPLSPSLGDLHSGNDFEGQTISHVVLYIVGSVTVVIAMLGAWGAYMENWVALTVFLVFMVIGSVLMFIAGVAAAVTRLKLESVMEERWHSFLPLDQASGNIKSQVEALQTSLHCCGLFSHEDWEDNIPDSCLCNQEEEMEGRCQSASHRNFLLKMFWQKKSVFKQACFPLIMDFVISNANFTLAVIFTMFVLALLGLVTSSLIIYQMVNTPNWPNTPLYVPVMFIDHPPAYQQLDNLLE